MSIVGYEQTYLNGVITVRVESDLSPPPIYYHWYVDGRYISMTEAPDYTWCLAEGDQARVEAVDTLDPDFDPYDLANAPPSYPPRRTLWWIRSFALVDYYRVEQQVDSGGWVVLGRVPSTLGEWSYSYTTGRLTDLASYEWRIIPVDFAGNDGTAITFGPETLVRTPDAPEFTAIFDTGLVTFDSV